jgi:predicted nucleotidyltransferase
MQNNELISAAIENLKSLDKLKAIILFGSYARGEANKQSDIDLLIVMDSSQPKKYLKEVINRLSSIDREGKISPRLTNFNDYDPELFQNVMREGKLLHGSLVIDNKKLALVPYRLINYDLSSLSNSKKVKISRRVYGYKTIKGSKQYLYNGLNKEEGVLVYPTATVLLPENNLGFIEFLNIEKVPYKEKKIWL